MAKYEVGVLGNFDGKVGTVVGASWRGIPYMRHKGRKSKKPRSQAQLEHQAKFKSVSKFVKAVSKLLMACYRDSPEQTGVNHAFSDIYAKALTGVYPAYSLDYSKISVSKGVLFNADGPAAAAAGTGIVKFTWSDNTDNNLALATDKAVLVAYCPELEQAVYTLQGAARSAGTDNLNMKNFAGKVVETWIAFMSANGQEVSSSIYTGQLTVS